MTHKEQVIQKIDDFKHFFVELNEDIKGKNAEEIFDLYFNEFYKDSNEIDSENRIISKKSFREKIGVSHLFPPFFKTFLKNLENERVGE